MANLSRILIQTAWLFFGLGITAAATIDRQQIIGLKEADYSIHSDPSYPDHSIRIRQQGDTLCDAGSKQYTGWLDTPGKHFFFWYFESMNKPEDDPLNLWMTGGPGCSGLIGMMLELGPCLVTPNGLGTSRNPFSWSKNSSMIFIDQPAGTGFSYVDEDIDMPSDSFVAAADMTAFLQIFYSAFPHLKSVPFHISGESYGGHYIPTLAAEIVRYNGRPGLAPEAKIPLNSVMIGDGFVSPLDTTYGYYDTLCTTKPGVPEPIFNATRCTQIAEALPRCVYLHEACYEYPDPILCHAADSFCSSEIRALFDNETGKGGRDPFDITRTCQVDQLCYTEVLSIEAYANTPQMRQALNVPKNFKNFTILNMDIHELFWKGNDLFVNTAPEVKYILEAGIDVLVYNGNLDLACNTAGNLRWTEKLSWAGQAEFVSQSMRPWFAPKDGETVMAGTMKEVRALTMPGATRASRFAFVTVDRAGHMVPLDQPEISLHLIQTWMTGGEF
ncbi:Alpha/Beta hydrolase protein [Ilyonectria robusta]|uniref:Alpha/Beta hydrolase protein n=1 Tax=Ilyonectria robusta TaxID=1079257 RepID=UPI001E8DBD2B|nr:Alpha/Beta hydrolase protein [Ilyonectria robusta]KAH8663267.1 Alpha/Beta hydrolase protein [Ilyonectria robusta]